MAGQALELMSPRVLVDGYVQPLEEVIDLGAYKQMNAAFHILTGNGQAGQKVYIQHAAIKDEGSFVNVTGLEATLQNAGVVAVSTDAFLRYVRVTCDATIGGSPVVAVYVVAKDG